MNKMVKFIVFGLQRTGTTLVVSILNSHPEILSIGELFDNKEKLESGTPTYKLYLKQMFPNRYYGTGQQKDMIYPYLDTFFNNTDFTAVGFKLMLNQAEKYPGLLDYLKEKKFKIIGVFRENLLETAISRMRARKLGIFNNLQPDYEKVKPLKLNKYKTAGSLYGLI